MTAQHIGASGAELMCEKLRIGNQLDRDDLAAIMSLPFQKRELDAQQRFASYGDTPQNCCIVLDGWLARSSIIESGRQIFSLHLPGDMPDLLSLHTSILDHDLHAIAASTIALVPHTALKKVCADRPNVASALWRECLLDAAIFRQWIANLGRRAATPRTAHFLLELRFRLAAIGLITGDSMVLPLTQIDMADCLGISAVHVNRVLHELKNRKLLDYDKNQYELLDRAALERLSDFDPLYLENPRL